MTTNEIEKIRKEYREYLSGKKVVVVGPAPSIVGSQQCNLIESYDVVVRLNKAIPVPKHLENDIGIRTDVLYNCMNPSEECGGKINPSLLKEAGVKFLVSPYAPIEPKKYRFKRDIENYLSKNGMRIPFCYFDAAYFKKLLRILKLPNTGINAILDILSCDVKELYITGFTFFKGGYMKEYRGYTEKQVLARMARFNLHDQDKQLKYMREILLDNPRIKLDKALEEILKDKKLHLVTENKTDARKISPVKISRSQGPHERRKKIRHQRHKTKQAKVKS